MSIDWTPVHSAIEEWYRRLPERNRMRDAAETETDVDEWIRAMKLADEKVKKALHDVTRELNTVEKCRMVSVYEIERMSGWRVNHYVAPPRSGGES